MLCNEDVVFKVTTPLPEPVVIPEAVVNAPRMVMATLFQTPVNPEKKYSDFIWSEAVNVTASEPEVIHIPIAWEMELFPVFIVLVPVDPE